MNLSSVIFSEQIVRQHRRGHECSHHCVRDATLELDVLSAVVGVHAVISDVNIRFQVSVSWRDSVVSCRIIIGRLESVHGPAGACGSGHGYILVH